MVNITRVDLLQLATSISYTAEIQSTVNASTDHVAFVAYDQSFIDNVLGPNPSSRLVAELPYAGFHEAGVYNLATEKIYAASAWNGSIDNPINITIIDPRTGAIESTHYDHLHQANGGRAYYPPGTPANSSEGQAIIFTDSGDFRSRSGLTLVDPPTNTSKRLLDSFFGRNFSSINDVVQHPYTGDLWFTDARYAYWSGFGPEPNLRPQVYRFEPLTGYVQAVADFFTAPNGIEFSPDYKHVYIGDSGSRTNEIDYMGPASIYRFDVSEDCKRLRNRELFAYTDQGAPDGLHTDTNGNVYAGVDDGLYVWDSTGRLIGKFGGMGSAQVSNFVFVPGGLYVFTKMKLWFVEIKAEGRTVKRDFGLY
ncbi:Gluconolactonase [Pseudocercospora fuligena]|uniref:Gluconolactonase n=1 Tax=Pseudocercospora fuligena TaxID=685502 RepID=A0A8H6RQ21_9PEZI|nr:Gluconolactonase [Pseudocercospora fuligena]